MASDFPQTKIRCAYTNHKVDEPTQLGLKRVNRHNWYKGTHDTLLHRV